MVEIVFQFGEKEENVEILQILGVFKTPYHKKRCCGGVEKQNKRAGKESSQQLPCVTLSLP